MIAYFSTAKVSRIEEISPHTCRVNNPVLQFASGSIGAMEVTSKGMRDGQRPDQTHPRFALKSLSLSQTSSQVQSSNSWIIVTSTSTTDVYYGTITSLVFALTRQRTLQTKSCTRLSTNMILRQVLYEGLLAAIARRVIGQGPSCADGALCPSDQPCCGCKPSSSFCGLPDTNLRDSVRGMRCGRILPWRMRSSGLLRIGILCPFPNLSSRQLQFRFGFEQYHISRRLSWQCQCS